MNMQELHYLLRQTLSYMTWQAEKMNRIEDELKEIRLLMERWINEREKPSIERIEYQFDQLKIETLEGTLNIGLTPNGGSQIEEMVLNQKELKQEEGMDEEDPLFQSVSSKLSDFLEAEAYDHLVMTEQKYHCDLTKEQRKWILDDIRKQLPQRIRHYLQSPDTNEDQAFHAAKNDIIQAIDNYMHQTYGSKEE